MAKKIKSNPPTFILNDKTVPVPDQAGKLVLDYLRRDLRLVGSKEGCKEGDCGACVVLVGELKNGSVRYQPVTSCLMPVGELAGKHLVTVEGVNQEALTPVQQAIVDEGGSQCGFCTPGIVMSLTALLLERGGDLDEEAIRYALGGNLCRCTGYASLLRAGKILTRKFAAGKKNGVSTNLKRLVQEHVLPDYFLKIPAQLKKVQPAKSTNGKASADFFVAGGTDIYVQRGDEVARRPVGVLNRRPDWKGITVKQKRVEVGALTTFEEFADDKNIQKVIPDIWEYMMLNASWQIRNRATIGGNVINASPIGDMTALLLALEAEVVLRRKGRTRKVPLRKFYKGYKKLDKAADEIAIRIDFPRPAKGAGIHFEKVSKRRTLDIASVNSAIKLEVEKGVIRDVHLSAGGVAPIPLYLAKTCERLRGAPVTVPTVRDAIAVAMTEIAPISDIRGSADYKRLLLRQFIIAHFCRLAPDKISMRDFYETH